MSRYKSRNWSQVEIEQLIERFACSLGIDWEPIRNRTTSSFNKHLVPYVGPVDDTREVVLALANELGLEYVGKDHKFQKIKRKPHGRV